MKFLDKEPAPIGGKNVLLVSPAQSAPRPFTPLEPMPATVKKMWVEALRSGRYKQAYGAFKRVYSTELYDGIEDRFCALGVLIDLYEKTTGRSIPWLDMVAGGRLPVQVATWAGLPARAAVVLAWQGGGKSIDGLNDEDRLTFPELASLIDKQL